MSFAHDAVGRRTSDEDNFDVASRRTYTYLPNGRLGTVSGQSGSQVYVFSIMHDTEGRPVHVVKTVTGSVTEEYDFYYNLAGDLRAARKTVSTGTPITYRWSYDYLNGERIAAQREKVTATNTTAKRFIFENDFRGSPRRVTDRNGITYFGADYLASGWRNALNYSVDMYVPFSLPGQIVLEGTEATASGAYSFTRPAIHLNGQREHDPFLGSFLQPDPLDVFAREDAEAYSAMGSNALANVDPTGLFTVRGCGNRATIAHVHKSLWAAVSGLLACTAKDCSKALGGRSVAALLHSRIRCWDLGIGCGETDGKFQGLSGKDWSDHFIEVMQDWPGMPDGKNGRQDWKAAAKWGLDINVDRQLAAGDNSCHDFPQENHCLAKTLGHEGLHLGGDGGGDDRVRMGRLDKIGKLRQIDPHGRVRDIVDDCITCPK